MIYFVNFIHFSFCSSKTIDFGMFIVIKNNTFTLGYRECNSFGFEGLITPVSKQWENTQMVGYSKKDVFPRNKIRHALDKKIACYYM